MPIVSWDGSLSINHQLIDQHHEHLVDLLNKTYDEFCENSIGSMGPLLEELIDYATYHFATEEQLMTESAYPDQAGHLEEHRRFVKRVTEIQKDFLTGGAPISLEIISFMMNWLVNHISNTDNQFGNYARTHH